MSILHIILQNFFSFLAIISLIVFVHEFGHFIVARLCGVKVETFSLGFGKELFGRTDKKGTRWKFCILPVGGYVKMYGDKNAASVPDLQEMEKMTPQEKKQSFVFKNVYQRFAVVAAGPVANFIFAIFIFTFLFKSNGLNTVLPVIDEVVKDGAAFASGLKKDDEVIAIDDKKISDFNDIRQIVTSSANHELAFKIKRQEQELIIKVTPQYQTSKDIFGDEVKTPMLGISASKISHKDLNIAQAFVQANVETYKITLAIFDSVGQLITGKRSVKELGGPIKIAQYSGKTVEMGIAMVAWFMAMISINLGAMNLLPVPMLDGGHLAFYIFEMIAKKPLTEKTQQTSFQIGMALLLVLMLFTTLNDIYNILH